MADPGFRFVGRRPTMRVMADIQLAFSGKRIETLGVLLGALAYIVMVDSRDRWPLLPWHRRLFRVLTFYRG